MAPYFEVFPHSVDAVSQASRQWLAHAKKNFFCNSPMRHLRPTVKSVDIGLDGLAEAYPMSIVFGADVAVARTAFLGDFLSSREIADYLLLGRVRLEDESGTFRLREDFVTYRGVHRVVVRGTSRATINLCPDCKRQVYLASGAHYLWPAPPPGIPIFVGDENVLIVNEAISRRIDTKRWKKVSIDALKVLDKPKDKIVAPLNW